jgi:hypothetical protein
MTERVQQTAFFPPRIVFVVHYNVQYRAVCALIPTERQTWPMEGHIDAVDDPLRSLLDRFAVPVTEFDPTRMHNCLEEADPNPTPGFHPRCRLGTGGGRNQGLWLGSLVTNTGTVHRHVVAKTVNVTENPLVGWEFRVAPGHIRPGNMPVDDSTRHGVRPPCNVLENLLWLRDHASHFPNLLTVLAVDEDHVPKDGHRTLTVYSPWCEGGDVHNAVARFGEAATREIMAGALCGLHELNVTLGLLHYDLKPSNIFVAGCLHPVGVIGDLDNVVRRNQCQPTKHRIISTVCYGAPFQHCDPRRDQVAFLLTLVEVLSEVSWFETCYTAQQSDNVRSPDTDYWGWASAVGNTPGMQPRFWPTPLYRAYRTKVTASAGGVRVPFTARFC